MAITRPYFLTNEEWYILDPKGWGWLLTDKAPQEAVDDYNKFMERERYNEEHGID